MPENLFACFADTRGKGTCSSCGATLTWMTTAAGKKMCFDGDPVPRKSEHSEDRRLLEFYSSDDVHWALSAGEYTSETWAMSGHEDMEKTRRARQKDKPTRVN